MGQIFISYSSSDTPFAGRLAGAFEELGWSVWWDKQIPPGMDYARVIEAAITGAQCVVVLWSRNSIQSRWVHTEAAAAADRNIVATVIIDDIPNEQIPFEFKRLQAVNLSDWEPGCMHDGFDLLANRIRSILDEPPLPAPRAGSRRRRASWGEALTGWGSGAQPWWRGAAALTLLAAIAGFVEAAVRQDLRLALAAVCGVGLAGLLLHLGRRP